ncbi:dimethylarginine dimethylaminohydrolase family protein [Bacillus massiliglaciei]|uniref:dimethylarginine dimethylaminohydrolase family protein n=1 Tax=Bacillus massiliglaciei TaxID=1816693 RepID=UPI000A485DCA|nr:dimethylarginine dimethylaminohydrolase family protein [Bacillus massiliglaciei]
MLQTKKSATTACSCRTEYGTLEKVIVCDPEHMKIRDIINETQKKYIKNNINITEALKQHNNFVAAMEKEGIEVIKLPSLPEFPEQVFTRDIGFTIDDKVYLAEMAQPIRQGEEEILRSWLTEHNVPYHNISKKHIEGGDVILDGKQLYIGQSSRTHEVSIDYLNEMLPDYDITAISFEEKYLHLDCIFNVISPNDALVYRDAIDPEVLKKLESRYHLIEVPSEEQFTLGTNVLSIGDGKIISLPVNKKTNDQLRKKGFTVIEVDISEIIKSGGSFRCCSMPLRRA